VAKRIPTPEGAVLRFFRTSKGVSEERLASLNRVSVQTLRRWEWDAPLTVDRLAEVLAPIGVPPEAVETALLAHRLGNAPPEPGVLAAPSGEARRLIRRAAGIGGRSGAEAAEAELTRLCALQEAPLHRSWADEVWSRLKTLPKAKQALVAEAAARDDRSWALAERLCLASETLAAHRADESLRLARLGLGIAERSRLEDRSRWRLAGWCEPFVGNSLRVGGDLKAADTAFARGDELWQQGEGGDPSGILDGTRRLDLKASLRMYQEGKTEEALSLIDQALKNAEKGEVRSRLLLKRARALELDGQYEASLEVLERAKPLVEEDSRLKYGYRLSKAVTLCHLGRYSDAAPLMSLVQAQAEDSNNELDKVRATWLKGRVCDGLGRREEAIAALSQVREYLDHERIPFDFALATLELACAHLQAGRARQVRKLASEMLWIFQDQRVHKHALAAISLFCHTAELDALDEAWTRRLVRYLYRAQYKPTMPFEG
jgi:tetratricopeptide (TPR) repeat protein